MLSDGAHSSLANTSSLGDPNSLNSTEGPVTLRRNSPNTTGGDLLVTGDYGSTSPAFNIRVRFPQGQDVATGGLELRPDSFTGPAQSLVRC